MSNVVQRGESFDDSGCRYKWNWDWVDQDWVETIDGEKESKVIRKVRFGEWIRKLSTSGFAFCELCRAEIKYANRGFGALQKHADTNGHRQLIDIRATNSCIPGEKKPPKNTSSNKNTLVKAYY